MIVSVMEQKALEWIKQVSKGKKATRSDRPYIEHEYEGLDVLEELGANMFARAAYCLHRVFQTDEALSVILGDPRTFKLHPYILMLVMEYRSKANSYLCGPTYDNLNCPDSMSFPLPEVREMLIADKVQNQSDFRKYHLGKHKHSDALEQYFINWLRLLDYESISGRREGNA